MKKIVFVRLFVFMVGVIIATKVSAQHFIVIQSDEKQPFTAQINGISFNSAKNGNLRISDVAAGNYNLIISFTGNKYPPQNFTCTIDKNDETYALRNLKEGWVLKNIKNNQVIRPSNALAQGTTENPEPPVINVFAQMLAQVVNDPDLLKPTVWVINTHVNILDSNVNENAALGQTDDTVPYQPSTAGVIKASETPVKEGTEMVFVDFNSTGGDTIHVIIPSTENAGSSGDSSVSPQANKVTGEVNNNDTSLSKQTLPVTDTVAANMNNIPIVNKKADVVNNTSLAVDTPGNKQYSNPFFSQADGSKKSVDNSSVTQDSTSTIQPLSDNTLKAMVKEDCKKMMTDADQEKLKHRIYLETDVTKAIAQTKKFLDGRCINTAQVKELASFFLSDDDRFNFLQAVYPFVYDYGNFGSLASYMIDNKYKVLFRAMLK